jgi:hypothetical protein
MGLLILLHKDSGINRFLGESSGPYIWGKEKHTPGVSRSQAELASSGSLSTSRGQAPRKPCSSLSRPRRGNGQLSDQGMANLPVKAERVHQASQSPAMLFAYREHFGRARRQRLRENCIRVGDGQNHSDRPASERLRA